MFSNKHFSVFILLFAAGLIAACGSALYIPSELEVTSKANLEELNEGRSIYINKCGGCHTLVLPEKYSDKDWGIWVDKMEVKANITPSEKEKIMKYLTKGK